MLTKQGLEEDEYYSNVKEEVEEKFSANVLFIFAKQSAQPFKPMFRDTRDSVEFELCMEFLYGGSQTLRIIDQ